MSNATSKPIHEYRYEYKGQQRWAQVYVNENCFDIHCFVDNVFQGIRTIKGHSEVYAENAAENFVLGLYDRP